MIKEIQPSHSLDIEQAVLGAILLEKDAFSIVSEMLDSSDFYSESNQVIYETIKELDKDRKPIDMLTIVDALNSKGKLDSIGGAIYIANLTDSIASSVHLNYHAGILKEKAVERKSIESLHKAIKSIQLGESIGDVLFSIGKNIEAHQEALIGKQSTLHISSSLRESVSNMYDRIKLYEDGKQSGVSTGLKTLNNKINGWQKSELIVIAGRPAMGKTAFLLHFTKVAALDNIAVALFSLEMSNVSLSNRLVLSECDVDVDRFKSGELTTSETNDIEQAAGKLWKLPIYVDDNPSVTMDYIRSKSRVLHRQGKCDMVLIDYLQLATESNKGLNREQAISQMSRTAKIIAKELNIPVILLSQLNRSVESREDKKPLLSDLRESGAIEQDADKVIFIYRPGYYGKKVDGDDGKPISNYGQLIIAKNRNGAVGIVGFTHNDSLTKIYDYKSSKTPF